MAITVTSLGTNQYKSGTGVSLPYESGLVAAAGDWLIVCFSGDLAGSLGLFFDASASKSYYFGKQVAVLNSGQASAEIWLFHLPVATAASDFVQVTVASTSASALAVYKVSGIDYSATYTDYTGTAAGASMSGQLSKRVGQYIPNAKACTISSLSASLAKTLSPTGTMYCRIRKVSDDSLIGTLGTLDVATLTASPTLKTFNSTPVTIAADEPIYVLLEYEGGDETNYVNTYQSTALTTPTQYKVISAGSTYTVDLSVVASFSSITGGLLYNPFDKSAAATGTGTAPSSGACDTLSQAEELGIGVIGVEDVPGDVVDTFTAGAGNVSGNEQTTGTTGSGDSSNITIVTAAEVLSATTAQTAAQTGNNSTDWAALVATFRAAAGVISQIATVPRASIGQMATVASAAISQVAGVVAN